MDFDEYLKQAKEAIKNTEIVEHKKKTNGRKFMKNAMITIPSQTRRKALQVMS